LAPLSEGFIGWPPHNDNEIEHGNVDIHLRSRRSKEVVCDGTCRKTVSMGLFEEMIIRKKNYLKVKRIDFVAIVYTKSFAFSPCKAGSGEWISCLL
jgi:hypothetical protein